MRFALSAEQAELRRAARGYLATHWPSAQVRAVVDDASQEDPSAWRRVAAELGWASILVPEAHGGAGLGWVEATVIAEETGRALASVPFFSSVCLATNALLAAGDEAQRAAYLPRIASGDVRATLAFGDSSHVDPWAIATVAREQGDGFVLSGTKRNVVDGAAADVLLVTARAPGTTGEKGVALFAVHARSPGVHVERTPALDATRPLALVTLKDVHVGRAARMGDAAAVRRTLDRAAIALASEALGGAERCLEMATDYAKTRVQFDRPIGSFQAIKHRLADLFTAVETARSAARYAAGVADSGDDAELAVAAALAKSYCTETFFRCAAENIQIHGGIGFTWEHDAHLFLKRARGSLVLLGGPSVDRERVAQAMGLDAAPLGEGR
jgi:alkylation response protein AidB-like acyl-CoA dehydrogenase